MGFSKQFYFSGYIFIDLAHWITFFDFFLPISFRRALFLCHSVPSTSFHCFFFCWHPFFPSLARSPCLFSLGLARAGSAGTRVVEVVPEALLALACSPRPQPFSCSAMCRRLGLCAGITFCICSVKHYTYSQNLAISLVK